MSSLYQVQKILDKKVTSKGGAFYKVKWLGYSEEECTWQPYKNLVYVDNLVQQYEQSLITKKQTKNMARRSGAPINEPQKTEASSLIVYEERQFNERQNEQEAVEQQAEEESEKQINQQEIVEEEEINQDEEEIYQEEEMDKEQKIQEEQTFGQSARNNAQAMQQDQFQDIKSPQEIYDQESQKDIPSSQQDFYPPKFTKRGKINPREEISSKLRSKERQTLAPQKSVFSSSIQKHSSRASKKQKQTKLSNHATLPKIDKTGGSSRQTEPRNQQRTRDRSLPMEGLAQIEQNIKLRIKTPPPQRSIQPASSGKQVQPKILGMSRAAKGQEYIYMTQEDDLITYRSRKHMLKLWPDEMIRFYESKIEFAKIPKIAK